MQNTPIKDITNQQIFSEPRRFNTPNNPHYAQKRLSEKRYTPNMDSLEQLDPPAISEITGASPTQIMQYRKTCNKVLKFESSLSIQRKNSMTEEPKSMGTQPYNSPIYSNSSFDSVVYLGPQDKIELKEDDTKNITVITNNNSSAYISTLATPKKHKQQDQERESIKEDCSVKSSIQIQLNEPAFGQNSCVAFCNLCNQEIVTQVILESDTQLSIFSKMICCFKGLYSKLQRVHRCPSCQIVLAKFAV